MSPSLQPTAALPPRESKGVTDAESPGMGQKLATSADESTEKICRLALFLGASPKPTISDQLRHPPCAQVIFANAHRSAGMDESR